MTMYQYVDTGDHPVLQLVSQTKATTGEYVPETKVYFSLL